MATFVLRLPLFGTGMARFALVRFCRMLGTLVGAGVPLIASLRVAKEAIGNQVLADTVTSAIESVQKGHPLARSLEACPRPALMIRKGWPVRDGTTVETARFTGTSDRMRRSTR